MRNALLALALALIATAALADLAVRRRLKTPVEVAAQPIPARPEALGRGEHLGRSVLICAECHGPDLGGAVVTDAPGFGRIVAPNLTAGRGGIGPQMGDLDWDRAVRHGVAADGRPLVLMPSDGYAFLSIADVGALRAWVEQLPPVDRALPPTRLGPLGRWLAAGGRLHVAAWTIDHGAVAASPGGDDPLDGERLARVAGCFGCHGEDLRGREIQPGRPPAPSLLTGPVAGWTRAELATAVRAGRRPDGSALDPLMPSRGFAGLSDAEVDALWRFLAHRRAAAPPPSP
jgi:cytochrome c553